MLEHNSVTQKLNVQMGFPDLIGEMRKKKTQPKIINGIGSTFTHFIEQSD